MIRSTEYFIVITAVWVASVQLFSYVILLVFYSWFHELPMGVFRNFFTVYIYLQIKVVKITKVTHTKCVNVQHTKFCLE